MSGTEQREQEEIPVCGTVKYNTGVDHCGEMENSIKEAGKLILHMENRLGSLSTPSGLKF